MTKMMNSTHQVFFLKSVEDLKFVCHRLVCVRLIIMSFHRRTCGWDTLFWLSWGFQCRLVDMVLGHVVLAAMWFPMAFLADMGLGHVVVVLLSLSFARHGGGT